MRWRILILGLVGIAVGGAVVFLFTPLPTARQSASPNDEFVAVAAVAPLHQLIPAMPGQAGDKPGRITVRRRDGLACGSVAVPMISMLHEIIWDMDVRPRVARIGWWARWNLDACRLESGD